MFSLFFLPSVMWGFFRSSWAIGESRTSRGADRPLYLVEVDSTMNLPRSRRNLARPEGNLVGRPAQVVEDQLVLRESAVKQRLEMAVILHPLGQGVADEDDPV